MSINNHPLTILGPPCLKIDYDVMLLNIAVAQACPPYTPPCSRLVYSWEEWLCLPCQSSSPSNSTARGGRSSSSGPTAGEGHCKSSAGGTVYICMRHAPVTGLPACVHVCTKERVSCIIYWNSDCDGRAMRPPVHLHKSSLCGH